MTVRARIIVFVVLHVVFRFAVEEPVHKDLVYDGALCPVGHLEAGDEGEVVFRLIVLRPAELVVTHLVVVVIDYKIIINGIVRAGKIYRIIIEHACGMRFYHLFFEAVDDGICTVYVILERTQ